MWISSLSTNYYLVIIIKFQVQEFQDTLTERPVERRCSIKMVKPKISITGQKSKKVFPPIFKRHPLFSIFKNIYLFIFGWGFIAGSLLLHGLFSSCDEWGLLSCGVWVSHCSGFSCCRAQALGHMGFSSTGLWPQQWRLLGSGAQTQQLWRMGLVAPLHVGSFQIRD